MSTSFATVSNGDPLNPAQVNQFIAPINALEAGSAQWAGNTAGTANAYTASITPAPASLTAGLLVKIRIHVANTGASTLNLNGLGAVAIRLLNAALAGGELAINSTYILIYDGTYWQVIGGGGGGGSVAIADVTGLQAALDGKAASSHSHAIADTTGLQTALDGKAASSHSHAISDVTGLQTALDGKAASSHNHPASAINSGQVALANGGTGANLSATGGAGHVLKQASTGAAVTVGALAAGDMPSGIDAAKIADGSVSNTEFQYLNGVTSNIQAQINAMGGGGGVADQHAILRRITSTASVSGSWAEAVIPYNDLSDPDNLFTLESDGSLTCDVAGTYQIEQDFYGGGTGTNYCELRINSTLSNRLRSVSHSNYVCNQWTVDLAQGDNLDFILISNPAFTFNFTDGSRAGQVNRVRLTRLK